MSVNRRVSVTPQKGEGQESGLPDPQVKARGVPVLRGGGAGDERPPGYFSLGETTAGAAEGCQVRVPLSPLR